MSTILAKKMTKWSIFPAEKMATWSLFPAEKMTKWSIFPAEELTRTAIFLRLGSWILKTVVAQHGRRPQLYFPLQNPKTKMPASRQARSATRCGKPHGLSQSQLDLLQENKLLTPGKACGTGPRSCWQDPNDQTSRRWTLLVKNGQISTK